MLIPTEALEGPAASFEMQMWYQAPTSTAHTPATAGVVEQSENGLCSNPRPMSEFLPDLLQATTLYGN